MRKLVNFLLFAISLFSCAALSAQEAGKSSQAQDSTLSGRWVVNCDFYGSTLYFGLEMQQSGETITGKFDGDKFEGTVKGADIHFLAKDEHGGSEAVTGTLQKSSFAGPITFTSGDDPTNAETHSCNATKTPPRWAGKPRRHDFTPTIFYRQFSPLNKPVLTVSPGDTIHTTTVDAGGKDEKGVSRVLGGNPETGPFYIETASPGDTVAIHFTRIRLNRDWAVSDDGVVDRAKDSGMAVKMKDGWKNVRWHLDLAKGTASPEKPAEHLANYSVPLRPMLGCVAVAAGSAQAPPGTGDSGRFGGNMDFNDILEGSTVFLTVNVPGALIYVGDGHATQGDGELNGNALETSMDVEFTVDVIPQKHVPGPRVESATHLMAMGLGGSLEDALRAATANMSAWLEDEYKLTPSEIAQVLGSAAEYKISEVADRNAGIVLKINKERLKGLASAAK
jgi:acetamidase/formamidase